MGPGSSDRPSVGGAGGRDADSFYVQDCQSAQANTHAIQNLTGQISRLVGSLANESDYQACRRLVDDAVRQASETQGILKRIQEHQRQAQNPSERSNRRMMYFKLSDNLAITARVLEDVVKRFNVEEERFYSGAGTLRPSAGASPSPPPSGDDAAGGDAAAASPALGRPAAGSEEEPELIPAAGGGAALLVRPPAPRGDEDMRCLQRIYSDLALTQEEQQETTFQNLASHMADAGDLERPDARDFEIETSRYNRDRILKRRLMVAAGGAFAVISVVTFLASA